MKIYRHSIPVDKEALADCRKIFQKYMASTGAEKTLLFRAHAAEIRYYGWYCRVVDPKEGTAPTAVQKPLTPAVISPAPAAIVCMAGKTETKAALSEGSTKKKGGTNGKFLNMGILYRGAIRTPLEMRKLTGKSCLTDFNKMGAKLVRY